MTVKFCWFDINTTELSQYSCALVGWNLCQTKEEERGTMAICFFLSVLLAVFGLAAAGDLGEACAANNACTPPTAVCETSLCKTKAGESCAGAAATTCVSHSTCDSKTSLCTCDNGYTAGQTDLCSAIADGKLNAACGTGKLCTGTNVECTSGFCTCKDGFTGNKGDDDCTIADGKVNAACGTGKLCTGTKVDCTGGFCTCKDGFTGNKGDNDCSAIAQGKVNAACDATTKLCTGTNVECTDNFCACKDGFSGNKGDNDCTAKTQTNTKDACDANKPCTGTNMVCTGGFCTPSNKGVALGQVSVWTLCMTILTVSLAVNVV